MTKTLVFYFDYIDPGSFLVHRTLQRLGVPARIVRPIGIELAPPPTPLLDATDPQWIQYGRTVADLASEIDLEWERPAFQPWTRKAHELALHAAERDLFEPVHEALFRAHFEEGVDLGRIDVLVGLATRVGLDPTETKAVLDVDRFTESVERNRLSASVEGLGRVPTIRAGELSLEGPVRIDDLRVLLEGSGVWAPGESPER
jgi:predicted DsbA family dithiol-disulfide isomerase